MNRSTPVRVQSPAQVTEVTFDGTAGTNLVSNDDGSWSVDSPEHDSGTVDVVVNWTLGGVPQEPIVYANGYLYDLPATAPTITDPEDVTVQNGENATFTVTTTGEPAPAVTWERSMDEGATWEPATSDEAKTRAADPHSLTVTANADLDGVQYRAVASNDAGSATSNPATLSVKITPDTETPDPDTTTPGKTEPGKPTTGTTTNQNKAQLANTGASTEGLPLILAVSGSFILVAAAATLLHARRVRRSA